MRYIKISKYTKGFGEWPSKVPPNKRPKAETELPYQHIRVQILRLMKCKLHISNYCFFMALFYPVQHNLLPYSTYSIGENFQEKEKQPKIWTSLMFLLLFFFPWKKCSADWMIVTSQYWNCFCSSIANSEAITDQNLKCHYKLKAQTIIKLGRASSKVIWVFRRKFNNIYQRIYLNTKQSSHKCMEPCASTKTSFQFLPSNLLFIYLYNNCCLFLVFLVFLFFFLH